MVLLDVSYSGVPRPTNLTLRIDEKPHQGTEQVEQPRKNLTHWENIGVNLLFRQNFVPTHVQLMLIASSSWSSQNKIDPVLKLKKLNSNSSTDRVVQQFLYILWMFMFWFGRIFAFVKFYMIFWSVILLFYVFTDAENISTIMALEDPFFSVKEYVLLSIASRHS